MMNNDKKKLPDSIPGSLTGVRSCPPPPEVKAPEWDFWKDIPEVKLWQACALALNIDPDSMERNQQVWKSPRFDKLLRKLEANISSKQHFTSTYPYDDVRLSEFAAWCGYIDFDILPGLAALANNAPQAVNILAEALDDLNPADIDAELDPFGGVPYLHFNDAGQGLFSEWRATLEIRLRSGEEHPAIVSHLSKYRKLIPSLALINHLCDSRQGAVSEAALLRAIAFGEYLESHAQRIYSYATRPDIEAAKTLLKRLGSNKLSNPFTVRDVHRAGWTGLDTSIKAQAAINLLLEYHHLSEEEITTVGRPTTHYHWIKAGE